MANPIRNTTNMTNTTSSTASHTTSNTTNTDAQSEVAMSLDKYGLPIDTARHERFLKAQYAFIYEQKMAWGDMDAFNHLNNVMYYRYAESARIGYLNALGLFSEAVQVVLAQSSCQYLMPVVFPDTLKIGVRCQHLGNSSMVTRYAYYSEAQQAIVAIGEAVLVRLDAQTQQKLTWSQADRNKIEAFDGAASLNTGHASK